MKRRRVLAGLVGLVGLSGCARAGRAHGAGPHRRVVSLGPATTEALFTIGAGAFTVGRTSYCDRPPEARALPVVGGYTDPSLEAILALAPDLVTGARGPTGRELVRAIEERGCATYFPPAESRAEVAALLRGLGARTGREAGAEAALAEMDRSLERVRESVAGRPRRRALLLYGRAPLVAAGPKSFADEMLALAGLENACRAATSRYPTLDLERVAALDPDVILDASMDGGPALDLPLAIRAVREGRARRVQDPDVLRPGPSFARGVAALARAGHGLAGEPG